MRRFLLPILMITVSAASAAQTGYRLVHPDGTVEYSDEPIPGGEEIKLREAPTIEFAPATPATTGQGDTSANGKRAGGGEAAASEITITSPQPNQTVWYDDMGMSVSVSVKPPAEEGAVITITLNGSVVATGSGSSFHIGRVYRGSHTLRASVTKADGTVLATSPAVTFHMRQHSVLDRKPPPAEENRQPGPSSRD